MTQPNAQSSVYPNAGEVVDGKYRIERLIGEGGMGAVAKATHLVRRAPVVLKFMNAAVLQMSGAVERFINEAVAASQIDSDHIVRIFDTGTLPGGAPYLVMEYLEGFDLATLVAKEGQRGLPVARSVHFALQILRALQVAHAAGIVHRDMKPANCFVVTKDGEPDFVKLLDFGISKVRQPGGVALTQANAALGTPLYMSPEQARSPRDVDLRSDLYSTGAMLYELLTGTTPLVSESGEITEIIFKLFSTDPPPIQSHRPDLPDGLARAVHHALMRDVDARVGSAAQMADAIAPWADGRSITVLSKIRGSIGGPLSFVSLPPAAMSTSPQTATARHDEATAATMHANPEALQAVTGARDLVGAATANPVTLGRTDLGAARDNAEAPRTLVDRGSGPSSSQWVAIAGGLVATASLLGALAWFVVFPHAHGTTASNAPPPITAVAVPDPTPLPGPRSAPIPTPATTLSPSPENAAPTVLTAPDTVTPTATHGTALTGHPPALTPKPDAGTKTGPVRPRSPDDIKPF